MVGNLITFTIPDGKVHGANMGPIWGRQDPSGSHIGPMNFAIRDANLYRSELQEHSLPLITMYWNIQGKVQLFFSLADCCSLDQANAFSVNNSIKTWICEDNWLKNYRSTLQIIKAILNVHLLINTNINKWWIVIRIKMHWHFTTAYLLHLVVDKSFAIQLSNRFLFA